MEQKLEISHLSLEQRELLHAASANQGVLQVMVRSDTHGPAVCAGNKAYSDPQRREVAQRYLAEVPHLQELQLLRQAGRRNRFELTNIGWEVSRKLQYENRR